MVRGRRTRATATSSNTADEIISETSNILTRTNLINNGSEHLIVDDQFYASPKRKESKIDTTVSIKNTRSTVTSSKYNELHYIHNTKTRSSQKTINKYFTTVDADPLSKKSDKFDINGSMYTNGYKYNENIEDEADNVYEDDSTDDDENDEGNDDNESDINGSMNCSGIAITSKLEKSTDRYLSIIDLTEENYIDTAVANIKNSNTMGSIKKENNIIEYFSGPTKIGPSLNGVMVTSSTSTSKNNLFLQEPVLSLNIDKSPNQPSSIKINKTFEVGTVFSTVNPNPNCNSSSICLNGFNKIVTLNSSPKRSGSSDIETNSSNSIGIILSIDNNSSDSGVVIDHTSKKLNNSEHESKVELSPNKRRKPTTPHRILCPSPVKHPLVEKSTVSIRSPNLSKNITASHGLPNGAQRRFPKSRRRLNANQSENSSMASPQLVGGVRLTNDTLKKIMNNKQQQQQKNVLNSAKNPTAEQNTNNNFKLNQQKILTNGHNSPSRQNGQILTDVPTIQHDATNDVNDGMVVGQMKPPVVHKHHKPKNNQQQHTHETHLTDFFPVRRSVRKTKTAVKEEMMRTLEQAILENSEDGLKIEEFEGKGRGVLTTRRFQRGEFVVEYIGDLIDMIEANRRENKYSLDENTGCYMYYFKHKNQQYCIDATAESGKLGRLVNHSRNGNLMTKVVVIKSRPRLVLLAKDDIQPGVELTYDYGDRSKEALQHHPWLAL